jgi:hypothetical protein
MATTINSKANIAIWPNLAGDIPAFRRHRTIFFTRLNYYIRVPSAGPVSTFVCFDSF